jgi:predicted nucleic acid-binding protein
VRYLVDTSAWVEAMRRRGDATVRQRVGEVLREGLAATCDLVLVELWNGVSGPAEQAFVRDLEREAAVLPTDDNVWRLARALAQQCRSAGFTVPATDLVIAACARHHGADLIHRDAHFDRIASVAETQG